MRWRRAETNLWTSDGPGGSVMRRLLPTAIIALMVLGFLSWQGVQQELYGSRFGLRLLTVAAIGLIGGLLLYFARWLDRNEAVRREVEAKLRRSSRYFDLSRDLVCTAGFDGVLKQLNPAWTLTLGWSEDELRSRPFVEFVHPDDREMTERESAALARGDVTVDFVNRYATKDGGWRWIDWKAVAIVQEGLIYASARDVTDRKEAEAALEASERQTRKILETAHDAFISFDARGLITAWNPPAEVIFGWSREEVLGRDLIALLVPEARRAGERRTVERFLATGQQDWVGTLLERTMLHHDGQELPIEMTISPVETDDGYTFNAFMRDISARKASEELLEHQRRQLVEVQSVGGFGSWEWNIATGTIEWSEELCRIYGVEPDVQRSFEQFLAHVHPDDRAQMQATVQAAYETREPYALEHRIVRPDGVIRVLHGRGEVITDDAQRPMRMLGTGQDVTEEKAAEETRGRAALVEFSKDAIIAETLDGVIESWNRGAQELFGYSPEEAVGKPIAMLLAPDRRDELTESLAQIKRGERVDALETVRIAKDGRAIDVSMRISLVYDADGELVGASSISRDITDQKLLEAQLRRSSRYFDLSRDLTVAVGFDGYFKSVNPALEHILGWSREEFLTRPFIDMVHVDDRAATLREVEGLADGNVTFSLVNRYAAKDGSYRWLDWNAIVPPDEPLMYASARDMTERMEMETALREAEQRFRTAFDRAPIGVCLLSLDPSDPGRLLQVNPALAEILGSSVEELTGAPVSSLTHPDDHADLYTKLAGLTDCHSGPIQLEKRFMHSNGHPVWALISAAPLTDDDGAQRLAVTHVMDISDRKQAEGQLQHLADHDALTGLFNRRRFTEELERTLRHAKRFEEAGAVVFLDSTASSSSTIPSGMPPGTS